ncbi:hypothetical protein DEU56DRAFT_914691 [Suillus clintonianus]|uniref:uncharacterized protein n=1 Tax=Suillus clintonianus TaxID=1904413 RepID=UPI001B87529E|nr:uncharacterized protein DEU56DRAFT_914691 [Suillus clintonianus]KAG2130688.1 hypothetical protein DEU56DRAFT_914691 [Suillus clintonianus]
MPKTGCMLLATGWVVLSGARIGDGDNMWCCETPGMQMLFVFEKLTQEGVPRGWGDWWLVMGRPAEFRLVEETALPGIGIWKEQGRCIHAQSYQKYKPRELKPSPPKDRPIGNMIDVLDECARRHTEVGVLAGKAALLSTRRKDETTNWRPATISLNEFYALAVNREARRDPFCTGAFDTWGTHHL